MIGEEFSEVLAGAKIGSERSIVRLWRDLHPLLLGYLRAMDRAVADDVESETWLRVARGLDHADEYSAVAMMAHEVASPAQSRSPRRSPVCTKFRSAKVAAATLVGGLSLVTGLAMAGALPGAAQDVASNMLDKVGVSTPSPDGHAGDHPDTRGNSADHPSSDVPSSQPSDPGRGAEISNLATTTNATGVDKGAEISSTASNGTSQAGQNTGTPPVDTPNSGGTGTADSASGGNSSTGTGLANNASSGDSSAGAGNAADHKP